MMTVVLKLEEEIAKIPYPEDTTLTAENEKDLKVLIMKIKKHNNKNGAQIVVHFQMLDVIQKK